jgi:hypothetical protein
VELGVEAIGKQAVHAEHRGVGVLAAKGVLNRIEVGQPSTPTEQKQYQKGAARFHSTIAEQYGWDKVMGTKTKSGCPTCP